MLPTSPEQMLEGPAPTSINRREALTGATACVIATALPAMPSQAAPPSCSLAVEALRAAVVDDDDLSLFRLGISSFEELPPCISTVIVHFIASLPLPEAHRSRLLPYVVRLIGSAGNIALERRRAAYIAQSVVSRALVP